MANDNWQLTCWVIDDFDAFPQPNVRCFNWILDHEVWFWKQKKNERKRQTFFIVSFCRLEYRSTSRLKRERERGGNVFCYHWSHFIKIKTFKKRLLTTFSIFFCANLSCHRIHWCLFACSWFEVESIWRQGKCIDSYWHFD